MLYYWFGLCLGAEKIVEKEKEKWSACVLCVCFGMLSSLEVWFKLVDIFKCIIILLASVQLLRK